MFTILLTSRAMNFQFTDQDKSMTFGSWFIELEQGGETGFEAIQLCFAYQEVSSVSCSIISSISKSSLLVATNLRLRSKP